MRTLILAAAAVLLLSACDRSAPTTSAPAREPGQPLFEGLGGVHFAISTQVDEAQRYFDQGLALAFAFNHAAADLAFTEAAAHDPDCAMCYWGSALVLGPNLNAPMDAGNAPRAQVLAAKAAELAASGGSPPERALTQALLARYGEGEREALDTAYADAMRGVVKAFPDNDDIVVLGAESLMDLHPWNFWLPDGSEQPWTPEVVATIEQALALNPDHVGAIHLYIHAVEQSNDANRAAGYADRLASLAPTAGHLVHMPAHIYIRVGRYHDSTLNNIKATEADSSFLAACRADAPLYKVGYVPHNWHFGAITAAIEGWSAKSLELARGTADLIPDALMREPTLAVTQHFYSQPLYLAVRFARWDDILATPEPASDLLYARAVWQYATGMAKLRKGDVPGAKAQLAALTAQRADPVMAELQFFGINTALAITAVAQSMLEAELMRADGDLDGAIDRLQTALDQESELNYTEPPDWFYPVRHALGDAQLAAGDAAAAARTYRDDLAIFPENGWALFGLAKALRAQGDVEAAADVEARFDKAWAHADMTLTGTRL
jgi:tetratricopeptide (TPR) repeat protein